MRGVTLIELLIVISLGALIVGIHIGPDIEGFNRNLAQVDAARIATILRHERARAVHGVLVQDDAPFTLLGDESIVGAQTIHFDRLGGKEGNGSLSIRPARGDSWELVVEGTDRITLTHLP